MEKITDSFNQHELQEALSIHALLNVKAVQEEYAGNFDTLYHSASDGLKSDLILALRTMKREAGFKVRPAKALLFYKMKGFFE